MAYHFHWSYEQLMQLDHGERQRWAAEVAQINRRLNEQAGNAGASGMALPS